MVAVVCGLALTMGLTLYALRSNIDLFYTPSEILYGKNETQKIPVVGQRLRVGGMVMPGSVRHDSQSLQVYFTVYDAQGSVEVTYQGILPDLFSEGQRVVAQGAATVLYLQTRGLYARGVKSSVFWKAPTGSTIRLAAR